MGGGLRQNVTVCFIVRRGSKSALSVTVSFFYLNWKFYINFHLNSQHKVQINFFTKSGSVEVIGV